MPLLDNLEAYWELEESSGTRVDSHGSNDLTDNNTVGQGTGILGSSNCGDFESGNSEYLNNTSPSFTFDDAEDFTVSCWVKRESGVVGWVWALQDAANDYIAVFEFGANFWLRFNTGGTQQVSHGTTISNGTWYHLLAEFDASENKGYLNVNNGTRVEVSVTLTPNVSGEWGIGALSIVPGSYFDGLIDEVGVWSRLLTSDEKSDLYNSGSALAYSSFTASGGGGPAKGGLSLLGVGA